MPSKHPGQRQQPFQLRVADTASPYRIADIFGEVLVYNLRTYALTAIIRLSLEVPYRELPADFGSLAHWRLFTLTL